MSPPPRFLFVADCGAAIGGGHVMRSLTLAEALAARGAACAFAAPSEAQAIIAGFGGGLVEALPSDGSIAAAGALGRSWRAGWVVIDHYRLVRADETALRAPGRRIAVIDDLAERERDCDLLLDPSYGRTPEAYDGLTPPGATLLTGPRFALVRPQFAAARAGALARRGGPVRRAVVSLGLTDVGGITAQVVERLRPALGDIVLDVVVGRGAPSLPALEALGDPRLRLHVDVRDMAALLSQADVAVGAGGSSTWERCCLGLPSLNVVLADNQRPLAAALDRDGVSPAVSDLGDLAGLWRSLVGDEALRDRLSVASAALCDGLGAGRAAHALLSQ